MTPTALINAKIYTVNDAFDVHENGAIVFDASGILAVGPVDDVEIPPDAVVHDCQGRRAVLLVYILKTS